MDLIEVNVSLDEMPRSVPADDWFWFEMLFSQPQTSEIPASLGGNASRKRLNMQSIYNALHV